LLSLLQHDDVLVSNEVINSRVPVLAENVAKWGNANIVVTNSDPAAFGARGAAYDVVVVDAPCSGSGLFRKDADAMAEWSEANVALCAQRQQRIIADVWPAIKPGGLLIYATCSFSPQEDENILDWLAAHFGCQTISLQCNEDWGILHTLSPAHHFSGYRFYPYRLQGEGFFLAAIRKTDDDRDAKTERTKTKNLKAESLAEVAAQFVRLPDGYSTFLVGETWHAVTQNAFETVQMLQAGLHIRQAGVALGEGARKGFVPDHALALSSFVSPQVARTELPADEALRFLRRQDISLPEKPLGFALMTFEGLGLGWAKNLGNRVNNYYPTEWRIRN
jgi:NOL1/NOP2/fmu family ribosome biogenesis protein